MKTKVLFNFLCIIISFLFVCCFVIEASAQEEGNFARIRNYRPSSIIVNDTSAPTTQSNILERMRKGRPLIGYQSDTLHIEHKDVLLARPLMGVFLQYDNLFKRGEVLEVQEGIIGKGYSASFILKDSILYLKRVTQLSSWGTISTDKNDTSAGHLKKVSEKEIKARVEKMTGRKFGKNGLLKADWVNGEFLGYADGKFIPIDFLGLVYQDYKAYKVIFEKGVLRELIKLKY